MKRGSEEGEGDKEKEAKKPKEMAAPAPAPAPAPVKEDEPPVCNVGNLLEICDQDVDFAVELVGEGGQEMTGHAAKAVQQATNMEGGWLATVRKSTPLQFGVSRGRSEVLLSGCGRVYLSEIVSKFELKTWPRCRDSENNLTHWLIPHRLTAIKTHAHSIKGVAGNLGMERLRAHAAATESWARTTAAEVDRKPEDGPLALEKSQRLVELVAEVVEWGKSSRSTIEAHARANPV